MKILIIQALLITSFFIFSLPARAIINTDTVESDEVGTKVAIDMSVNGSSGSSNVINSRFNGMSQWKWGEEDTSSVLGRYQYGRSNGAANTDSGNFHIRNRHKIIEGMEWEVFGQAEKDRFTRKKLRVLAGSGARVQVWNSENTKIHFGIGAFWELEKLTAKAGVVEQTKTDSIRLNSYLNLSKKFTDTLSIGLIAYYQPRVDRFKDYRFMGQGQLKIKINDNLDFNLNIENTVDAGPPIGINKNEYRYSSGISASF